MPSCFVALHRGGKSRGRPSVALHMLVLGAVLASGTVAGGSFAPVAAEGTASWPPADAAYRFFFVSGDPATPLVTPPSLYAVDVTASSRTAHQVAPPCNGCGYIGPSITDPVGRTLFTVAARGADRWIVALDPVTEKPRWRVAAPADQQVFTTSADGATLHLLDSGATRTRTTLLDATTGATRARLTLAHPVTHVSPDRRTGWSYDGTGTIRAADLTTGVAGPTLTVGPIWAFAPSADGASLIVARRSPSSPATCAWTECQTEFFAVDRTTGAAGPSVTHPGQLSVIGATADGQGLVVLPIAPKVIGYTVVSGPPSASLPVTSAVQQPVADAAPTVSQADGTSVVAQNACLYDCSVVVLQTVPGTGTPVLGFAPPSADVTPIISQPSIVRLASAPAPSAEPGRVKQARGERTAARAAVVRWKPAKRAAWYQAALSKPGSSTTFGPWTSVLSRKVTFGGLRKDTAYSVRIRAQGPGGTGVAVSVRVPRPG